MGCPPVREDNPRALAYVQVDKHGLTILYHLHQCSQLREYLLYKFAMNHLIGHNQKSTKYEMYVNDKLERSLFIK